MIDPILDYNLRTLSFVADAVNQVVTEDEEEEKTKEEELELMKDLL